MENVFQNRCSSQASEQVKQLEITTGAMASVSMNYKQVQLPYVFLSFFDFLKKYSTTQGIHMNLSCYLNGVKLSTLGSGKPGLNPEISSVFSSAFSITANDASFLAKSLLLEEGN